MTAGDLPGAALGPLPAADLAVDAARAVLRVDGGWQLAGSACAACGAVTFPQRTICHHCASEDVTASPVGHAGELYSWATVHVSSARPVPYTLGYVDLPRGLRVLALIGGDPDQLWIGQPMELAVSDDGWTFVPQKGKETTSER